ncbi:hypothetical protein [Rubritalea tangerina]|uniref:Ubiquinone biosynthesis protein UbiA n=1 Tax=Rubritalea tangerina TaxID=430798 RepID=A0ABW4Z5Y1_9BACT
MNKLSALLATGRISNLPTVWSNILIGFLSVHGGALLLSAGPPDLSLLPLYLFACLTASLLYVGGCFLGDAVDLEFDLAHKPERPIPTGVLERTGIYQAAFAMLSLGTLLPIASVWFTTTDRTIQFTLTACTLALTASIVAYSYWHKKSAWAGLPLIGACRFFLILFAAAAAWAHAPDTDPISPMHELLNASTSSPQLPWMTAAVVGVYTISFASVARSESSPRPITWRKALIAIMLMLPLIPFLPALLDHHESLTLQDVFLAYPHAISFITALLVYWVWMGAAFLQINKNKGSFVAMSLAGFSLLDATSAGAFGWPLFFATLLLFIAALTLQKWAPAT